MASTLMARRLTHARATVADHSCARTQMVVGSCMELHPGEEVVLNGHTQAFGRKSTTSCLGSVKPWNSTVQCPPLRLRLRPRLSQCPHLCLHPRQRLCLHLAPSWDRQGLKARPVLLVLTAHQVPGGTQGLQDRHDKTASQKSVTAQ